MKTFKIEEKIGFGENDWADRGTINGKSPSSILKRAFYQVAQRGCFFDDHKVDLQGMVVFHSSPKLSNMPIIRLIELGDK